MGHARPAPHKSESWTRLNWPMASQGCGVGLVLGCLPRPAPLPSVAKKKKKTSYDHLLFYLNAILILLSIHWLRQLHQLIKYYTNVIYYSNPEISSKNMEMLSNVWILGHSLPLFLVYYYLEITRFERHKHDVHSVTAIPQLPVARPHWYLQEANHFMLKRILMERPNRLEYNNVLD